MSIRLIPDISPGLVLSGSIPSSSHRVLSNFSSRSSSPDNFASSYSSLASSPNASNEKSSSISISAVPASTASANRPAKNSFSNSMISFSRPSSQAIHTTKRWCQVISAISISPAHKPASAPISEKLNGECRECSAGSGNPQPELPVSHPQNLGN